MPLFAQILIALVLAVVVGYVSTPESTLYPVYEFLATLFLNALKMIIVPLVMASIIIGVAGIGGTHGLGRLGGRTLLFYITTSFFAIVTGLLLVNIIAPGVVSAELAQQMIAMAGKEAAGELPDLAGRDISGLWDVFLSMVPPNIIAAGANGQLLGLIFFAILYGYFLSRIDEPFAESQYNFWQGVLQIMMKITELIMKFAPLGVFALVAKVMAGIDPDFLSEFASTIGLFFFTVVLALLAHLLITLPVLLYFVARVNPLRHFRAMAPALLTAFSTASSSATLPLTMECVEKNAGVSNRTTSFVLPLGATVNMDGTALYECVVAIFIAQLYGMELSFTTQFLIVWTALITSIGVAGIPSASLVAITIILGTIGLPLEAIAVVWLVDRVLDMMRTAVNIFSDSCGAVIIGKLEGEQGILESAARNGP
ncbi:MAG TPA: dicarboxylate/amino acid:cation symporter [Gammaproteobacteria bacterium]|nr:dicarboxylate/amino acid:cation symporter [Gammaproteobacteria bacterium]